MRAKDGRLWFLGGRGVTVIDPGALAVQSATPVRVRIESAYIDDRRVQADSQTQLPPRTTRLEIQYAVLNLASLLKTRFRHRLDGFDADWIDAGTRTEAFYTNLPPRNYQFQVIASNDDGTWTEPAATWDFSIAPMFYQTTWFAVRLRCRGDRGGGGDLAPACSAGPAAIRAPARRARAPEP